MSWSNTFTQSSNVNGGNEYTVYDVPTASMFNIPINNTQYLYEHKVEKEINDGMFYGKFDYNTASPYLRAGDVGDSEYSELDVQSNGIYLNHYGSGTTISYNIFDKITDIETRLANLGFKQGSFEIYNASNITTVTNVIKKQGKRCIANLEITATPSGSGAIQLVIPSGFRPDSFPKIICIIYETRASLPVYLTYPGGIDYTIQSNGIILLSPTIETTRELTIKIINAGWELA